MESKIENISNNQGLIDLFKGLIGSNLNLKNGIEGDNFSSMLEKFSHNTTKDKFSNNIKNTENSKDNITYKNQDVNQNKNETNNVNLSNSLEKQKEVKDISQNVRNTSEIKQNSKEEAQKIKPIKTDETVQTSEDELKENAEIPEELNEIIDVFDENITDVVLKLDDNLINTIISALKETNTLSTQELSNIKDKLEDFKETFSNVNFSDLLDNIKQVLQSENISNENISEFIKNISNTVSELIKENKISLSAEFVVENDDSKAINLKIDSNKENAQDDEQSNLTLTFEKILKEIFRANMVESGDTENQSNNTFDFNTMFTKNNNNSQNSQEFVNVNFQEIIKESSIENSSMMNLKNNFNTTEDFIKTINADVKNSIDINIKNETSLKSLDTVTSLRVLERVQEVLKAVSATLKECMDGKGCVARWGGEEFLFVFDNIIMHICDDCVFNIIDGIIDNFIYTIRD